MKKKQKEVRVSRSGFVMVERPNETFRYMSVNTEPSLTKQAHKEECDINNIVQAHMSGAAVTHFNKYEGQYGEVSGDDFRASMDKILKAQQMFDDLPSSVRNRFGNSPAAFLDFASDANNAEELVNMGLAEGTELNPKPAEKVAPHIKKEPGPPQPETPTGE